MFCSKCGKEVKDDATECKYCHTPVLVSGVTPKNTIDAYRRSSKGEDFARELAVPSASCGKQKVQLPPTVGTEIKAKSYKNLDPALPFSASVALTGISGSKKIVKNASKQHDKLYNIKKRRKKAERDAAAKEREAKLASANAAVAEAAQTDAAEVSVNISE